MKKFISYEEESFAITFEFRGMSVLDKKLLFINGPSIEYEKNDLAMEEYDRITDCLNKDMIIVSIKEGISDFTKREGK